MRAAAACAIAVTLAASSASAATSPEPVGERVFTLTHGPTNPTTPGWRLAAGPSYELWSDGSLYFRGPDDPDRLYPELLVAELDAETTDALTGLVDAVGMDEVGGTSEFAPSMSHPPVGILVVGDGGPDDTFTSYAIADSSQQSPATDALAALIHDVESIAGEIGGAPVDSGRAIVIADPASPPEGDASPWPAPVEWSAMEPSIGESRCALIEGDAVADVLAAYGVAHGPEHVFDTDDGTSVVTGVRVLMPSEPGCPA